MNDGVIITTSLFAACQAKANISVLRKMLLINPSLASQPSQRPTAREMHSGVIAKTPLNILLTHKLVFLLENPGAAVTCLEEKEILLLKTAFHGKVVDDTSIEFLMHALCSYQYPFTCDILSNEHHQLDELRHQLSQRDETGNLPIHYAARSLLLEMHSENQHHDAITAAKSDWAIQVAKLVTQVPEMALVGVKDLFGRIPLFLALDCTGTAWNGALIVDLAKACPRALYRRDFSRDDQEATMLNPALFAATRADESVEHLSVAYELLRESPEFIKHALASSDGHD